MGSKNGTAAKETEEDAEMERQLQHMGWLSVLLTIRSHQQHMIRSLTYLARSVPLSSEWKRKALEALPEVRELRERLYPLARAVTFTQAFKPRFNKRCSSPAHLYFVDNTWPPGHERPVIQ